MVHVITSQHTDSATSAQKTWNRSPSTTGTGVVGYSVK